MRPPAPSVSVGGSVVADTAVDAPIANVAEATPTRRSFGSSGVSALFMARIMVGRPTGV